jgi:hypothetical protein
MIQAANARVWNIKSAITYQKKFQMQPRASKVMLFFLEFTQANIGTLPTKKHNSKQCSLF